MPGRCRYHSHPLKRIKSAPNTSALMVCTAPWADRGRKVAGPTKRRLATLPSTSNFTSENQQYRELRLSQSRENRICVQFGPLGVVSQRKLRTSLADGRPVSSRLVPSAGNPLGNTVSEREADDQSNCNFQHWGPRQLPRGPTVAERV
jgi:hypothetical protein